MTTYKHYNRHYASEVETIIGMINERGEKILWAFPCGTSGVTLITEVPDKEEVKGD